MRWWTTSTRGSAHFAGVRLEGDNSVAGNVTVTDVGLGFIMDGNYGLVTRAAAHGLHMVTSTPGGNDDYGAVGFAVNGKSQRDLLLGLRRL